MSSYVVETDDSLPPKPALPEDFEAYRTVSRAAIFSLVIGVFGIAGILFPGLLILPIAGLLLAISGRNTIKRYPQEFTGMKLATVGMVANIGIFLGGFAKHSVEYVTEVPEGYERISFSELQPDSFATANQLPKRALELNGKAIFVKGYVHPGVDGMGKVKQFVLVPDMGTCCFGGQPKLTDMILVDTDKDHRVAYRRTLLKLAGTFSIGDQFANAPGVSGVLYRMEANYSK